MPIVNNSVNCHTGKQPFQDKEAASPRFAPKSVISLHVHSYSLHHHAHICLVPELTIYLGCWERQFHRTILLLALHLYVQCSFLHGELPTFSLFLCHAFISLHLALPTSSRTHYSFLSFFPVEPILSLALSNPGMEISSCAFRSFVHLFSLPY